MGLFDIFKKPKTIQDDFFGNLAFIEIKNNPSQSYFEGNRWFSPIQKEVEYLITADPIGPSLQQRDFYKNVETNYKDLINKARPLIEQEFRNWKEHFEIQDFEKEFKLVNLSIPRLDIKELIWDMSFETVHDENHLVTVNFKDFEIDAIVIDG